MIRILFVAFAALLFLSTAAPAQQLAALGAARPALKAETTVTGSVVRIGDLIDNAGIVANVPIFRAPDLGATGTVQVAAVLDAVRPHAIVGLDPGDITEITVTRASRAIPVNEIESVITHALSTQYALGDAGNIMLNFDRAQRTIHVEPSAKGDLHVARVSYDARSRRFDALLDIPGANGRQTVTLTGKAIPTVDAIAVVRSVARGEILKSGDLVVERRARADMTEDQVLKLNRAIGYAARGDLQPGRPLRTSDLMKPEIVQRNEMITLVYEMPGIVLTVRGKATEAGAEGDTVTVLNEQSKRIVQGVVIGPGRVVAAGGGSARIATNIEPARAENNESRSNAQ